MDNSINKIFKLIDNLDMDEDIKEFYKDALIFEANNNPSHFKEEYDNLISKYSEEF